MIARAVAAWLLLASLSAAGTIEVNARAGRIVELAISATASADVSWEFRKPLVVDSRTYTLADGRQVIVFSAAESVSQYVVLADVIDWDARSREKTTWVVTVGDTVDPEPDPDPDPEPNPPVPPIPDVADKYGVGKPVAIAVAKLTDKMHVADVVAFLIETENALNSSAVTAGGAVLHIDEQLRKLAGWEDVRKAVKSSIIAASKVHGAGIIQVKNYMREARLAIESFK